MMSVLNMAIFQCHVKFPRVMVMQPRLTNHTRVDPVVEIQRDSGKHKQYI